MSHTIHRKPVGSASYNYIGAGNQPLRLQQISTPPVISINSHQRTSAPHSETNSDRLLHGPATQVSSEDEHVEKPINNTSQWKVDWQTSAILIGTYLAALGAAIGHLIFFLKLNGTHVREYYIPQAYITTISTLIAAVWGICLSVCVSMVFTQSLWNLLRRRYTAISDVDKLYGLLGNVFLIRPRLMLSMPILYLLAILSWSLSVLRALPPGALSIETIPYSNKTDVIIPTFNSSYIGNGSVMDVTRYMPGQVSLIYVSGDMRLVVDNTASSNLQKRIAYYFAIGEVQPAQSPCGSNCTFTFEYEGPYLDCTTETINTTIDTLEVLEVGQNYQLPYQFYQADYNSTLFEIRRFRPFSVPVEMTNNTFIVKSNQTMAEVNNTRCRYATATYTVRITYMNGHESISYHTKPLGHLDYAQKCVEQFEDVINFNSFSCGGLRDSTGFYFSDAGRKAVGGVKAYTMTKYLLDRLAGSMELTCSLMGEAKEGLNEIGCKLGVVNDTTAPILNTPFWRNQVSTYGSNSNIPALAGDVPNLQVDPETLNAALFNVTMTYMYSEYSFVNTTVVATMDWQILTYVFSRPLNLVLPYFIPLFLAMIALSYAFVLLYYDHHVAAMSNSFIQILMTTTGTETVTKMAAGGCLGGGNNIPKELEKLKIKYGDVTGSMGMSDPMIRRAGFGIEGEVQPLRRRAVYGSSLSG